MTHHPSGPVRADYAPFAHLTAPNAALYRQVMRTFLTAKERFAVHLRPEDVHAALDPRERPAAADAVVKALDSLVEWGNLRADPDTARVTAVEDFYRKRFIYQLTRAGEAAEAALGTYDETLGRRGELQAVALHDIVTQLRALLVIAAGEEPDPAKAHVALSVLTARFTALAENARAFMGSLQRTIDLHDVEVEAFLAYKDRLIRYLERFIQDLITLGGRIALLIGELEQRGHAAPLLRLAAAREAADAAPDEAEHAGTATLVLSGVRALTGFPEGSGAQWRREAWASAGLLRDDLASTVLTLNLRGGPALDWMADVGEPAVLTLRHLTRRPPAPAAPVSGGVRVCENPAVLSAAADAHGSACPPLVCLQGQPSAAALTLLRHLHTLGTAIHYHGDFDWGGLRIAGTLRRTVPWRPWRYTAADYRGAAATVPGAAPLTGVPAESPWEPSLAAALTELGVRVEEEAVLHDLLADLAPRP